MEFSMQEYWSGLPFPSPGDPPDPGIEPGSPALQADAFTVRATREAPSYWSRWLSSYWGDRDILTEKSSSRVSESPYPQMILFPLGNGKISRRPSFVLSFVELSGSHFKGDHCRYFPFVLWVAPEDKSRQWFIGTLISLFICPGPKPKDSFILIPEHWPQNHLILVIRKLALTCLNVLPQSNAGGHATIWLMISLSVMNPAKRNQVCSNSKGLSGRQA